MDRRRFLLISLAGVLARPPASAAQAALKIPRVGYLSPVSAGAVGHVVFRQNMRELGYVEGQSIAFREGFANGHPDRMSALAAELVREQVDVIVAASPPAIRAAKEATKTIPIVMITGDDPVRSGFVVSLARPGGNITGVTFLHVDLFSKNMELLRQLLPALRWVAFLWDPTMPTVKEDLTRVEAGARALGVHLQVVVARGASDYEGAFTAMGKERAEALVVAATPTFMQDRSRIIRLAAAHRLPAGYGFREDAEAGGLLSYGPRQADAVGLAATYVDRILKGAKPANLPIEQPTKFELVLNLKTAKALGLTIPPSLLARADQVIE
jgi:putative ABC transport system substrate-binding protein